MSILIVGLGNPGSKYQNTRHNLGFMVLDELARIFSFDFSESSKFHGEFAEIKNKAGDKIFFLKPTTFMNLSGESVVPVLQFYKVNLKNVLVIHDDLDLPLGKLRFTRGGSSGGHNGIKSIIQLTGSPDFHRLKLGIGRPKVVEQAVVDHVLEKFGKADQALLTGILDRAVKGVKTYLAEGIQSAMNLHN